MYTFQDETIIHTNNYQRVADQDFCAIPRTPIPHTDRLVKGGSDDEVLIELHTDHIVRVAREGLQAQARPNVPHTERVVTAATVGAMGLVRVLYQ